MPCRDRECQADGQPVGEGAGEVHPTLVKMGDRLDERQAKSSARAAPCRIQTDKASCRLHHLGIG